jgi:predicted metal-dependent hydrolase
VDWRTNEDFLYAVDLFNHRFWWEAHEVFEALWHAAGRQSPAGHCLQTLIQCAAAHLQAELAHARGAESLLRRARRHAVAAGQTHLGLDLAALLAATDHFVRDPAGPTALLLLAR